MFSEKIVMLTIHIDYRHCFVSFVSAAHQQAGNSRMSYQNDDDDDDDDNGNSGGDDSKDSDDDGKRRLNTRRSYTAADHDGKSLRRCSHVIVDVIFPISK